MTIRTDAFQAGPGSKKIFISRHISDDSPLQELQRRGHAVIAQSLITISQIRFTHTPKTDWIFFSSKNAIKYFFSQQPELDHHVKFAVMGVSSARFLRQYHIEPAFTGQGVDVTAIAKDFAKMIGNQTVLLPQAIDSFQTIQKQLSFSNNCYNLFVYKTALKTDFEIPPADILVFTSPSNVKAYYSRYRHQPAQAVVAIGSTTKTALGSFGVKQTHLPSAFTEEALLEVLLTILKSDDARRLQSAR